MYKKTLIVGMGLLLVIVGFFPAISSQIINNSESSTGDNDTNIYDLLIIAPERFEKILQSLVCHKNSYGVKTKLTTLSTVYEEIYWEGRDDAEKVKYYIKNAYDHWGIKYVLLVGGIKKQFSFHEQYWCPVRYVHVVDRWGGIYELGGYYEHQFISDLYFADIYDSEGNFSTWDNDGDGIYGEWNNNESAEDIMDLYPDVCVGRLPSRNVWQVRTVVKKIIDYESKDHTDSDWFKTMVVVAGDTYPGDDDFEGEVVTQLALDKMPDFTHVKLWTSLGTFTGLKDVIDAFNNGCGFLLFKGHGSPSVWATHPPNDHTSIYGFKQNSYFFIRNREKLPICIVGGCHNSQFNTTLLHYPWNGLPLIDCMSSRLLHKRNGGTIATFGNTALGYGPDDYLDPNKGEGDDRLSPYFFEEIGINGNDILGECWAYAISSNLDYYPIYWDEPSYNDTSINVKSACEWLLMGDPSLKIGGYSQNEAILNR